MGTAAEIGKNPVSKHQIQPEYGNEQADAGQDWRTRLARSNSQARTRTGKYSFSLFSWPRVRLSAYPVDPSLDICDDHTYKPDTYFDTVLKLRERTKKNAGLEL